MRPGHHRPIGTTTTMRFVEWDASFRPWLGSVAVQVSAAGTDDADEVRRAYRIVGIIEGRDEQHFRLQAERIAYEDALTEPHQTWAFYNVPRR